MQHTALERRLMESSTPKVLELLVYIILGVIEGCSVAVPVAIQHRGFIGYILAAYSIVGAVVSLVSGLFYYAYFFDSPAVEIRAIVFAGALGLIVPVALLLVRAILRVRIKSRFGEIEIDMKDRRREP